MNISKFNTFVAYKMKLRGMKQRELAEKLQVDRSVIAKRLTGQSPWSFTDADKVAETFGLTLSEFLKEAGL